MPLSGFTGVARVVMLGGVTTALTLALVVGWSMYGPAYADGKNDTLILLVDTSASMSGAPLRQAQAALSTTIEDLDSADVVGLREFSGSCGPERATRQLVAPATLNHDDLSSAVAGLEASGGTPMTPALEVTLNQLRRLGGGTVVLISDGADDCGGEPCVLVREATAEGLAVEVNTIAFGQRADAGVLRCMADATGGAFVSADDQDSLRVALDRTTDDSGGPWWLWLVVVGVVAAPAGWLLTRSVGARQEARRVGRAVRIAARPGRGPTSSYPADEPGAGPTVSVRIRPRPATWKHETLE